MSGEKLFTETTSGGCTDGETRRTYQRERKYDGKTGNVWNPTLLCIPMLVFEERAVEDRQSRGIIGKQIGDTHRTRIANITARSIKNCRAK